MFLRLPLLDARSGIVRVAESISGLLWKAVGLFLILGLIDLVRQHHRYKKDLKMSKQEIREEHKEIEGNPQIKSRIRRIQRDLLRRQMMRKSPRRPRSSSTRRTTRWRSATTWSDGGAAGGRQGQELSWRCASGRKRSRTRCRSSRIRRSPRRCTSRSRSARRFRRNSTAPWPKCWPTSTG